MELRVPVVLDHDIGTNPDDFYAFDYLLSHPKANLLFVVSGNRAPTERAQLARRVLDLYDKSTIPSFVGEPEGCVDFYCQSSISGQEATESDYIGAVKQALQQHSRLLYISIQGLSNVERILRECPELNDRLLIYHMGLTTTDYERPTDGGTNMRADPVAAEYVYKNAEHLWAVGLQTTLRDDLRVSPGTELYDRLVSSHTELGELLRAHSEEFHARRGVYPAMHDAVVVAAALQDGFVEFERVFVDFTGAGTYQKGSQVAVCASDEDIDTNRFMKALSKGIADNGSM